MSRKIEESKHIRNEIKIFVFHHMIKYKQRMYFLTANE